MDYDERADYVRALGVRAGVGGGLATSPDGHSYFLKTPLDELGGNDARCAFVECPLAGSTMQLLHGRIYPCNRSALFGVLNRCFGTSFAHEEGDCIELAAIRDCNQIDEFRRTPKPMCRHCAHRSTERLEWRVSSREADEWLVRPGQDAA